MATPRDLLGYRQPSLVSYRQQGPTWTQDEIDAATIQRAQADRGSNSLVQGWQSTSAGMNAGDLGELALAAEQAGDPEQAAGLLRRMRVAQQVSAAQGPTTRSVGDVNSLSTAADWAGGALGSMARSAAPAMGAGLVGAGAGALMAGPAGAVAGGIRGAGTSLLRGLATTLPTAAVSFDQLRGEQVAAQYDDAEVMKRSADERASQASQTAALQTLPEIFLPTRAAGAIIERQIAGQAGKRAANTAIDTVVEGGTEALQQEIGFQGQQALGSTAERNMMDYIDAGLAGAVGGAGVSGTSNVLGAVGDKLATPSPPVPGESSDADVLGGVAGKAQQFLQDLQTEPPERAIAKLITPDRVLADDLQGADPEAMAAAIKQHDLTAGASAEETVASLLQQDRFSDRDKAQLASLQGKMEDPVNRAQLGVLMGKNRLQEVATATLEVVSGALKRGVAAVKSRFSMEGMDTSPLVNALAPVFGEEAPATAQKWIELASKFEGITSAEVIADPALAQSLETMADALDVMESKTSIRKGLKAVGLTSMVKLIDELQSVPGAKADLKKPDSFLRVMLQKRHERVFPSAAARKVDLWAPTYAAMSEKKQDAYAGALSLAFGSKEAAKAVLGHYAKLFETTRKTFEGQTNALPPNAGSSFERPSQAEAEAVAGGLTEGDFSNQKASYRDSNPARPFFADTEKDALDAEAAKGGLVAGMDEYVQRTGRNAAEAFGRVKTDLEQRLKASRNRDKGWLTQELERAVAAGADLQTRQTLEKRLAKAEVRTDLPSLEKQYADMLRDTPDPESVDPKRFDKALSRYRVVLRDEKDTQASDEDVHRFQKLLRYRRGIKPPKPLREGASREEQTEFMRLRDAYDAEVGAIDDTTITFTKADGKKLKTSAESMVYASQMKGGDLQKFFSAVSSMLDRDDIAGVDLPSSLVVFREGKKRKRRTLAEMRGIAKVRKQLQDHAKNGTPKQKAFAAQALALVDASTETAVNQQVAGEARSKRLKEPTNKEEAAAGDKIAVRTAKRAARQLKRDERDKPKYNEWREKLSKGFDRVNAAWKKTPGMHVVEIIGHGAAKRLHVLLPKLREAEAKARSEKTAEQWETVEDMRSEERVLSDLTRDWLDTELPLPDRQEYTSRLADDVQMEGDYTEEELQAAYLDEVIGVLEQRLALVKPVMSKEQVSDLYQLNTQLKDAITRRDREAYIEATKAVEYVVAQFDKETKSSLVAGIQKELDAKKAELDELMNSTGRNPRDGSRRLKDNPTRYFQNEEAVQQERAEVADALMRAELDRTMITPTALSFQGKLADLRKVGAKRIGVMAAEMIRVYEQAMGRLRRIKASREGSDPISYTNGPDGKPQALPLDPDTAYAAGTPDGSATKKGDRLIGPLQLDQDPTAESAKQRMDAIVPNATGPDPATEVGRDESAQDHAAKARAQRAARATAKPTIDAIQAQVMKAREKQRLENAAKEDDRLAPGAKDGAGIMKKIPDGPKAKFASTFGEIQAEQARQRAREEQVSKVVDTLIETLRGMLTMKSEGRASEAKPGLTEQRAAERAADTQALIERLQRLKTLDFETKMQKRKAAALERAATQSKEKASEEEQGQEQGRREEGRREEVLKQNAQSVGTGPAVPTTIKELKDALLRMRGKDIEVTVKQLLSGYGKYERTMHGPLVERLITIAHAAPNKMSVLYHEALHDFFAELGKDKASLRIKQQLLDAASTGHVQAQLRELLKGEPAALAQLSDPEERLAYMFQFRMADPKMMRIGPNTDTIFQRIAAAIRKFTGMVTELEKAEQILIALYDGRLADPSTAAKVMAEWNTFGDNFERLAGPIKRSIEKVFSASTEQLRAMNVPAFNTIADLFENNVKKSGLLIARAQSGGTWRYKLSKLLDGHSEKEIREAMVHMQSMKDPVTDLHNKLAGFFEDIRDWQIKKGVEQIKFVPTGKKKANGDPILKPVYSPLGKVKRYFPRVWDLAKLTAHGPEFSRLLQKHMGYSQKQADDVLHQLRVGDQIAVKPQGVAQEAGFSPYAQSVISRELILDEAGAEALAKFQSQDFAGVMTRYIDQAVHRAEYTERFGNMGEGLDELMAQAEKEGATGQQLERAKRLISGLDGTIHRDMNPTIKQTQMAVLTLQNLILLPLAVFSQLIDPLGIAVRSGDVRDAGAAYKRVLTDITQWASPKPDRAREMAEIIGAVQQDSVLQAMGMVHSGMYMSTGLRKINDFMFKYNGMQGINNSFRTAAVTAAEKYILEYRNDARRMEELDLTPADIKEVKKGEIDYSSEKIQQALFRFADGAVVRPNASHRPLWMSDPRFMLVAHLKQFAFSFQEVILKRVAHEKSYGNSGPLKILAMYAPIMIAADMAKWALTGNLPQNWSLLHLFAHGVHRSGILGVGTFGADVVNDVASERSAVLGFLGPTAQHLGLLASWIGGGVPVEDVVDRSVPLARLFTK